MANKRVIYKLADGKTITGLMDNIEIFLQNNENMVTQRVIVQGDNSHALQAKLKNGKIKQFAGMDKAITIRFVSRDAEYVAIEIGEAKWVDKVGIMALSMFVLWPLAITSGIGIYRQLKLPEKILKVARDYLGQDMLIG
ncbi:MAG: hypothetical protein LUE14_13360 [Clostridiales bacterium]|nr:hypothetical protein [Clostridiales bacterium]